MLLLRFGHEYTVASWIISLSLSLSLSLSHCSPRENSATMSWHSSMKRHPLQDTKVYWPLHKWVWRWKDWEKKTLMDMECGDGQLGVAGGGYGGINGDGRRLDLGCWARNTVYRLHVVESCAWNLYNFVNQCHPNRFNKKEKWVYKWVLP